MTEELREQIKVVAKTRRKSKEKADKRKSMYDAFIELNTDFFADVVVAATVVSEAEDKLRELTLQAYAETGNKAPVKGVGIREVTKLEYDTKEAFVWALEHKMFLKLDVKPFEVMAKSVDIDFVTITQEPQATIATNLEEVTK